MLHQLPQLPSNKKEVLVNVPEHSLQVDSMRQQGLLQSYTAMQKENLCMSGLDLYFETTSVNWNFGFLFNKKLFKIQPLFVTGIVLLLQDISHCWDTPLYHLCFQAVIAEGRQQENSSI